MWGANVSLTIQLLKNLTFRSAATYNTTNTRKDIFYGEDSSQAYRSGGVYGSTQMQKDLRWQNSNTLTYKHKINKKNSFDVMLGHEYAFRSSELLYGQAKDFPFDNMTNDNLGVGATPSSVSTSRSDKRLLSFSPGEIIILIIVISLLQQFVLMVLVYSLIKINGVISLHSQLHGVYQKRIL